MSKWLSSGWLTAAVPVKPWKKPGFPGDTAKTRRGPDDAKNSTEWNLPKNDTAPSEPERMYAPSEDKHSTDNSDGEGAVYHAMGTPNVDYPVQSAPSCSSEYY